MIDVAIERILRIPNVHRRYTVPRERAERFFRIPAATLDQLLDLGLPHGTGAAGLAFEEGDLTSTVMLLGLRSPPRIALAAMANALAATDGTPVVRRTLTVQAHCPAPGHEGGCEFELAPEVGRSPATADVRKGEPQCFEIDVRLKGGPARHLGFSGAERALVTEMSRIHFHHIPFELQEDLGFLAETGLADCTLAARFLATRGRQMGIEVRGATGLFMARPMANRHYWIELKRGPEWLPADPFFLTALARWGLLDPDAWPPDRSPSGIYWKLDLKTNEPVLTHRGVSRADLPERLGPASFLTR